MCGGECAVQGMMGGDGVEVKYDEVGSSMGGGGEAKKSCSK